MGANRTPRRQAPTASIQLPGFTYLKNNPLFSTPQSFLNTKSYLLNWAISGTTKGGWPFGKVVELYGDPSTGKSLLATQALAAVQELGGLAVLDDVEHAFDPRFATKLGLEPNLLLIGNSKTVEDCFETLETAIRSAQKQGVEKAVFVIDSVALLSSKHEQEVGFEKRDMTKASLTRQGMRMMLHAMAESGYLLIVLNHLIANIGDNVQKKISPGGSGVKFASSVRVELAYGGKLPGEPPKGVITRFKVTKNRCAPPFRRGVLRVLFTSGVTPWSGIAETLLETEVITKGKAGFVSIPGVDKAVRLSQFDQVFPSIAEELGYDDPLEAADFLLNGGQPEDGGEVEEPEASDED